MKIVNKTGYLKGAKTAKNPVNIIPSSIITTQGMAFPIKANGKTLYPNTGQYKFPTSHVVETPLKKKYQKGSENLKSDDLINEEIKASDAAKFTYRIKDKKRRDTQVRDMYNNTLDSFRGDTTGAKRMFKSFFKDYGSERFNGVRPLEGYYGFDRKDYDDKTLDSLGRDWHKQMRVTKKQGNKDMEPLMKYQKGNKNVKNNKAVKNKVTAQTQPQPSSVTNTSFLPRPNFDSRFGPKFEGDNTRNIQGEERVRQQQESLARKEQAFKDLMNPGAYYARLRALEEKKRARKYEATSPNIKAVREQERQAKHREYLENNPQARFEAWKKTASGAIEPTVGPIDAAIAATAGLIPATTRLIGGALSTTVPGTGVTVGQGLNALGAYDAIANRVPAVVENVKNKNYGGALKETLLGGLGLYGLKGTGLNKMSGKTRYSLNTSPNKGSILNRSFITSGKQKPSNTFRTNINGDNDQLAKIVTDKVQRPASVSRDDLEALIKKNLDRLDSEEYISRRMANTGETREQIASTVEKWKKALQDKTTFETGSELSGALGSYSRWKGKSYINVDTDIVNKTPEKFLDVFEHELLHGLSPTLKQGLFERNLYKNYPKLDVIPKRDFSQKVKDLFSGKQKRINYHNLADEQQVRAIRMNDRIRKDLGLGDKSKLTQEDLDKYFDEFYNTNLESMGKSGYRDVTEILDLNQAAQTSKDIQNKRSAVLDWLNRAWMVPAVGATGAAVGAGSLQGNSGEQKRGNRNIKSNIIKYQTGVQETQIGPTIENAKRLKSKNQTNTTAKVEPNTIHRVAPFFPKNYNFLDPPPAPPAKKFSSIPAINDMMENIMNSRVNEAIENSPNVKAARQKQREEEYRNYIKKNPLKGKATGETGFTFGPLDAAAAAIAGIPGLAGRTLTSVLPKVAGALNTPLTTAVPGVTAGNLLSSGFAADAMVNRLPKVPGQIKRGEYGAATENVLTGGLDLLGAGMFKSNPLKFAKKAKPNYGKLSNTSGFESKVVEPNVTKPKGMMTPEEMRKKYTKDFSPDDLTKSVTDELTYRDPYTNEIVYEIDPADYDNFSTPELKQQALKDLNDYANEYNAKIAKNQKEVVEEAQRIITPEQPLLKKSDFHANSEVRKMIRNHKDFEKLKKEINDINPNIGSEKDLDRLFLIRPDLGKRWYNLAEEGKDFDKKMLFPSQQKYLDKQRGYVSGTSKPNLMLAGSLSKEGIHPSPQDLRIIKFPIKFGPGSLNKEGNKSVKSNLVKYKEGSKSVSLAFSRGEKDPKGGLTQKGVDKYNRATGGNLKMAVTTPPSKLKPGSKAANRRKSFCARMSGVKGPMNKNGKPTRKALALRKWNC